jgi:hypothetical protein
MALPSAVRHLRRRHNDCWSCRLERLMVEAMIDGRGFVFEGPMPFDRVFLPAGRARD